MTLPFAALASSGGSPPFFIILILFSLGALLFYFGFMAFREYRILEDTPVAPVRSIPMGLVHVRGTATGKDRLISPLTGVPCYYYRVQVEMHAKKSKKSEWTTICMDTEERNFFLEDATGKVPVNPHLAEFEVLQTFQCEAGGTSSHSRSLEPTLKVSGPSDQDLQAYLSDNSRARVTLASRSGPEAQLAEKAMAVGQKLQAMGASFSSGAVDFSEGDYRYCFTEHCLLADRECNILGTCAENPAPKDDHYRNVIMRGENEKTFLITTKSGKEMETTLRRRALFMILMGSAFMILVAALELNGWGML
jgi:hypothetical protein